MYGQWVEEHVIPLSQQLQRMAETVERETYDDLITQTVGGEYLGDGSEEAEAARDVGLSFYQDISKMYRATLNLFSAGLFHLLEQQLADLTRDAAMEKEVSHTTLEAVVDWYKKHCQLDLTRFSLWSLIDELRLVANTTKHAEEPSANQLRGKKPSCLSTHSCGRKYAMAQSSVPRFLFHLVATACT